MPREKRYYVYILASKSRVLYVGVTGFLMPRVIQHKAGEVEGFTRRYTVNRLVYHETFQYVNKAIARETEIKKWRREKKVALIEPSNPTWEDLAADWGETDPDRQADSSFGRNDKRFQRLPIQATPPFLSFRTTSFPLCHSERRRR